MEKKYVLFLDNISRTVLGVFASESSDQLVVTNPVVLQIVNDQQNRIKVQLVPHLFRDLQKDPEANINWVYNKSEITRTELDAAFSEKFLNQYEFVVGLTPDKAAALQAQKETAGVKPAPSKSEPQVIKLFDAEEKK
jgi:hypothetical protein